MIRRKSQMLREAIQIAERGPSIFPLMTVGEPTPAQRQRIEEGVRLWLDSWILPAMRANLPKPRKVKP